MPAAPRPPFAALPGSLAVRVALYYAAIAAGGALLWRWLPPGTQRDVLGAFAPLLLGGAERGAAGPPAGGVEIFGAAAGAAPARRAPVALEVCGATVGAFLLALPVAWTYMLTREKKGYRQTTVHTLVLLPVVVAGVVVLVKTSLALAFSLAGIVAAVRFRNSLDDSKEATFLFLAVGIGLAAGVELDVAFLLSLLFNAATLALFYTDFGRTPPSLEGERARRQLDRALAVANRTSQFVAQVDAEVLQGLAPEQLDALASRVRRRREETTPDLPSPPELEFDARLRVVVADAAAARAVVEPLLEARVKRWARLASGDGMRHDDDGEVLMYDVRWKRTVSPAAVLDAVRTEAAPYLVSAELC